MEFDTLLTQDQRQAVEEFRQRHRTGVLTLLFTDMVGSGALKRELGDSAGTVLIEEQQEVLRETLSRFAEAEEIGTAGDSCFVVFLRPSDAVRFALMLHSHLRSASEHTARPLQVRAGVHMGEVFIQRDADSLHVRDVLGIQVDRAHRIMTLATGGQTLMSRGVFDNARAILRGEAMTDLNPLSWLNHGPYREKGSDEPFDVCEVGEQVYAPLSPPPDTEKAYRFVPSEAEPVLGWRPALELTVPGTEWVLDGKLGEGGFGEVWRANHRRTKEIRVFKFCFRADRLRSLKREMTLFRVLKEVLGERNDIARLYEVQFEEAPYYLQIEYTPGGNLAGWIQSRGGFEHAAMELRLEIVAQVAEALAAAHSVGVIHKDVKPSNVLVEERSGTSILPVGSRAGRPCHVQIRLTDFGIGQLLDREALDRAGVTATGFTETVGAMTELSARAGTRLYMAPELVAGRPPSIQSDIYSLGVLFYQMVIGDLSQPMTTDWDRRVDDPLVRDDLSRCLAGDRTERFASANELAERIRALPERRAESARREAAARVAARRRKAGLAFAGAAGLLVLLALALGYGLYRERIQRLALAVEMEKTQRQLYYANIGLAEKSVQDVRYDNANRLLVDCPRQYRHWEWGRLLYESNPDVMTLGGHDETVEWAAFSPDGKRIATGDRTIVKMWDGQTGREILSRRIRTVYGLTFTSDGRCLVLQGEYGGLKIRNLESDQQVALLEQFRFRRIDIAAVSPDGKIVATKADDPDGVRMTVVLDARNGGVITPLGGQNSKDVGAVVFSDDGARLAFGLERSPAVTVLNTRSWEVVREFRSRIFGNHPLGLSSDGTRLAVRTSKGVDVWDVDSGREIGTLQRRWSGVPSGIALSPNGTRCAVYDASRNAVVWEVETGKELKTLVGHPSSPERMTFNPDGKCVLATIGGIARVWDLERREGPSWEKKDEWICCVDFTLNGRPVAVGAKGQTLACVDLDLRKEFRVVNISSPDTSTDLGVRGIVVAGPGGRIIATFEPPPIHGATVGTGEFSVSASGWVSPSVWDTEAGREILAVKGLPYGASLVALSRDGKRLATTGVDCRIRVFDIPTGKELRAFSLATSTVVRRSGGLFPLLDRRDSVQWSDTGSPRSLVFDREARRVAAANSGTVKVFDVDSASKLFAVQGNYAAFSHDGRRLATICGEATLKIWDGQTGRELQTLRGHNAQCLAFSPDGRRLVSGGQDTTVKVWDVWDVEKGRELVTLRGLEHQVISVAVSPDGRRIAACDISSAVVWDTFPWGDDHEPGGSRLSFEEHVRLAKIERWQTERKRIEQARLLTDPRAVRTTRELDGCAANLRTLHTAIVRYRGDHGGHMPDGLSDLVPPYVTSNTLLCPADAQGTSPYHPDRRISCSYSYEFSPDPMAEQYHDVYGKTYRQWKEKQLKELGAIVPVVRCMHHGERVLSLSYGGSIFVSPLLWEEGPRQDYSTSATTLRGEEPDQKRE